MEGRHSETYSEIDCKTDRERKREKADRYTQKDRQTTRITETDRK